MSPRARRIVVVVLLAATAWLAVSVAWAVSPHTDSVPVGIDRSVDPGGRLLAVDVACHGAFGTNGPAEALPVLPQQPAGQQALAFQRPPCALVQRDARRLLVIDALAWLLAMGLGVVVIRRRWTLDDTPATGPVTQAPSTQASA